MVIKTSPRLVGQASVDLEWVSFACGGVEKTEGSHAVSAPSVIVPNALGRQIYVAYGEHDTWYSSSCRRVGRLNDSFDKDASFNHYHLMHSNMQTTLSRSLVWPCPIHSDQRESHSSRQQTPFWLSSSLHCTYHSTHPPAQCTPTPHARVHGGPTRPTIADTCDTVRMDAGYWLA